MAVTVIKKKKKSCYNWLLNLAPSFLGIKIKPEYDELALKLSICTCQEKQNFFLALNSNSKLEILNNDNEIVYEICKKKCRWPFCYPKNGVRLLVGVEPEDTTKPKIRRRKDLLLAASKEHTGDLSQRSVSPNGKTGEVLS